MLHALWGWKPVTRVPLTSFSFRPLARPENALPSPAFLLRSPGPIAPGAPGRTPC
jgi:hypothetical protein